MDRAAIAWNVAPSTVLATESDHVSAAQMHEAPANARASCTRAQALATGLVRLTDEEGIVEGLEAIERGIMGMSILLSDADDREALRDLAAIVASTASQMRAR